MASQHGARKFVLIAKSSKEQVGYEKASDRRRPSLPGPEGTRTACRGAHEIIKMHFGFKRRVENFASTLILGYSLCRALTRKRATRAAECMQGHGKDMALAVGASLKQGLQSRNFSFESRMVSWPWILSGMQCD